MEFAFGLILGALIGFGAEFAFDFFVMRRRRLPSPDPLLVKRAENAERELEKLSSLAEESQVHRKNYDAEKSKVVELQSVLKKQEHDASELQDLRARLADFAALQEQNKALQSELQALKELQADAAHVDRQLEDQSALQEEIQALRAQLVSLGDLKEENLALRGRLDQWESQLDEIAALKLNSQRLSAAESEREDLKRELQDKAPLLDEIQDLKTQLQSQSRLAHENDDLKRQLESLTAQVEDNQKQLEQFQLEDNEAEIAELQAQITALRAQANPDLSSELTAAKLDLATAHGEIGQRDAQIQELTDRIQNLEARAAETPSSSPEIDDLKAQLSQRTEEVTRQMSLVESSRIRIAELETALKNNLTEVSRYRDRSHPVVDLQEQILTLEQESAAKDDRIQDLENRLRNVRTDLSGTGNVHDELAASKSRANNAETAVERLQAALEDQEREIALLRSQLNKVHSDQGHELEAELKSLREQAKALEADVVSLKLVSASKDQAIAESKAALHDYEKQLAFQPSQDELLRVQEELALSNAEVSRLTALLEQSQQPAPPKEATPVPEVVKPRIASKPVTSSPKDPLIRITGIGHLYERKLWEAGILTFDDLAASDPQSLYEIIQPAEWQRIDPDQWISEAREMATEAAS